MTSPSLTQRLFSALCEIPILDPHSHINPHQPTAKTLDDLLGYHYYTELAHSAGMDHQPLEESVDPLERTKAILKFAERYDNTVQYSWLVEIAQTFFGWETDHITAADAECLWKAAEKTLHQPDWQEQVLKRSNVERVFLTNDFDDPLEGFDTARYVPCLRVDDLVFGLGDSKVRSRLAQLSGIEAEDAKGIRSALLKVFERFVAKGARACAVSLPPSFLFGYYAKEMAGFDGEADFRRGTHKKERIFWMIAECCRELGLPLDLMLGVIRGVYDGGVHQGRDLFDQQTSLIQYAKLFNAFPDVTFCISVLTSSQNQELASYSWIFPNVFTCGHWWYSNVPTLIERDLKNRLQAVPKTKQIAYYSDAYKLEFILPKFNMFRRVLAKVLAEDYVLERAWSEDRAIALGKTILRDNPERIFSRPRTTH
jgi:glucuronate isomerase